MSAISHINTSDYSHLLDSVQIAKSYNAPTDRGAERGALIAPNEPAQSIDLNGYYENVPAPSGDVIQTVSENVSKAANDLDNAMVAALENGYTVQDAVNIQQAKAAYEANYKVAQSTFEIAV